MSCRKARPLAIAPFVAGTEYFGFMTTKAKRSTLKGQQPRTSEAKPLSFTFVPPADAFHTGVLSDLEKMVGEDLPSMFDFRSLRQSQTFPLTILMG